MGLEFAHVMLHPIHDLVVVFLGGPLGIQIPQGKLLCQNFEEGYVLVGHDGLVNAAPGKGPGGDDLPVVQLHQRRHAVIQAVREHQTLHLVVVPDAVVSPGGIEYPVAYVHKVQQAAELLPRQMQIHDETSFRRW